MLSAENLASIEKNGKHIGRVIRESPAVEVPQYPGWTLEDLAAHLGWVHGRMVLICRDHPTERISGPRCPPDLNPIDWYERTLGEMLAAFAAADPDIPVWGFGAMTNIGFWERRMVIETGIHRWDADQAVGVVGDLDEYVATAGLDEYAGSWVLSLGDVQPLTVEAVDLGKSWRFGDGDPTNRVVGTGSDIYLRLMARPSPVDLPEDWAVVVDSLPPPPKP